MSRKELEQRGILRSNESEPPDGIRSRLAKKIEIRPSPEDLRERNILRGDIGVASKLHSAQKDLLRKRISNQLGKLVEERPSAEKLKERNILLE